MSETQSLLERISLLRSRLNLDKSPPQANSILETRSPAVVLEEQVEIGTWQDRLMDGTLRTLDAPHQDDALPTRLTARAARLLRKSRELLRALRDQTDDPILPTDEKAPLSVLHQESAAQLQIVIRAVQSMPATASEQLRLCEGLEVILESAEEQIAMLQAGLNHRRREEARVDYLTEILRRLAVSHPVGPEPLQSLADQLLEEARRGLPLRFLYAEPREPARFAAAHGLMTAQVLARVLCTDPEWQTRQQTAVMAALVHDVGMTRVPAEILMETRPLTGEQRRLIERHTTVGAELLTSLWPGGGWPVEAAADHHERDDGTGYPLGKKEIHLAPFVKLLAVCDIYAALICPRPYRLAVDPRTALTDVLLLAERDQLDRPHAERLLALSFYPAGTVVELNDGALALVMAVHPGPRGLANPMRPIVMLLTDAMARPLALPAILDLAETTDRNITRTLNQAERHHALLKKFPQLI